MNDVTEHQAKLDFPLDSATTKTEIKKLIDKLDSTCTIEFFDFYYPQISDPGAYVTVSKEEDTLKCQLANHGWSTEWEVITEDSLTQYIYKNREHNEGRIKIVARIKGSINVSTKEGIVLTPMYYKIDDKK